MSKRDAGAIRLRIGQFLLDLNLNLFFPFPDFRSVGSLPDTGGRDPSATPRSGG